MVWMEGLGEVYWGLGGPYGRKLRCIDKGSEGALLKLININNSEYGQEGLSSISEIIDGKFGGIVSFGDGAQ